MSEQRASNLPNLVWQTHRFRASHDEGQRNAKIILNIPDVPCLVLGRETPQGIPGISKEGWESLLPQHLHSHCPS